MLFTLGSISRLTGASVVPWVVVIVAAAIAVRVDLRSRRIPNWLTGPVLLIGLLWGAACALGAVTSPTVAATRGIGDSLLGALVASLPFLILWLGMGAGAGDAKLMMAIGAWLGMTAGLLVLLCTAIAGGALVIAWGLKEGRLLAAFANLPRAAIDLVYVFRGPGRMQDRRELVAVATAVSAMQAEPSLGSAGPADAVPRPKHKLPYAPAIFAGTCLAALRVFLA
jgi:Flp pilus assembly protein protease CpaA